MHGFHRIAAVAAAATALGLLAGCGQDPQPSRAPSPEPSTAASPAAGSSTAAPSGTDPAPYRTTGGALSFTTPWGAWCAILPRHEATPGTPTAGCWEVTGRQQVLTASPQSAAQVEQVQQGFYVYERGPALPAGAAVAVDGVRCAQTPTELSCTAGEHGFTLRPDNTFDLR
ncbi:hypothetical protein [Tsukamurella sp. 1534]|uniref:hypothetical protein n=1 Tax=Tsukamurella sp. 1534 TaxID=1151061 RepID=UPI0002DD2E4C|nr:hypothetical protein [Tsukamurella sp. 1534]